MEWQPPSEVRSEISPEVAREFFILPMGVDADRLQLVHGRRMSPEKLAEKEHILEFVLGRPVSLLRIEDFPDIELGFGDIIDRCYSVVATDFVTASPIDDINNVLLVSASERESNELVSELRELGFDVDVTVGIEPALTRLQEAGTQYQVVLLSPCASADLDTNDHRRLEALFIGEISEIKSYLREQERHLPLSVAVPAAI
ncbi:MAG: hypothetical protein ACJ8C4_06740 [Gemmataceae bacterium]